jgi:calcineurin-like phosphoesterase family protein
VIFFTADQHFNHAEIIKHCKRPFSDVKTMNETIINNWNNLVSSEDTVYILGDFAWNNYKYFIDALVGKKILITGSHDRINRATLACFNEVYKGIFVTSIEKTRFFLTHCPMLTWEASNYGSVNLHGHSHGKIPEIQNIRRMDVGVDVWEFKPVSLSLVLKIMNERMLEKPGKSEISNLDLNVSILRKRNIEYLNLVEEK